MKRLLLIALATLSGLCSNAQPGLLGIHWTGSRELFSTVNMSTSSLTDLDTLHGVSAIVQGESTFDPIHNIYFSGTTLGIAVVDAATGNFLDTIPNTISMMSMEYDAITNKLYGVHWTGGHEMFASLDISTGIFADIDSLPGVRSIVQGESSFDPFNRRYFISTNLGINIVDVTSGSIIGTIPFTVHLNSIEYDPNSDKIYGVRWDGSRELFGSVDIYTHMFTDIDTIAGVSGIVQGNSTYNPVLNIYYVSTDSGILAINPTSGAIQNTYINTVSLTSLEANYQQVILSLSLQPQSLTVNVSNSAQFSVGTSEPSATYQWQLMGANGFRNIANGGQYTGATSMTLSVTNTTLANNNQLYRCLITSNGHTNPSRIATLRVNNPTSVIGTAAASSPTVYCNTAGNEIVVVAATDLNGSRYAIYDQKGSQLIIGTLTGKTSIISYNSLASGMYMLSIGKDHFKIIRP